LGRAFHRRGYQVLEWDILSGPNFDLRKHGVQVRLLSLVSGAHYVHVAPLCSKFSVARGRGAPQSRAYHLGKPGLNEADTKIVKVGNILLRFSRRLVRARLSLEIPVSSENPRTSHMFLARPLCFMGGTKVHTVFCVYGTPWKRHTTLVFWKCPDMSGLTASCSSKRGLCDFFSEASSDPSGKLSVRDPLDQGREAISAAVVFATCRDHRKSSHVLVSEAFG
jgi:hypothetical protein